MLVSSDAATPMRQPVTVPGIGQLPESLLVSFLDDMNVEEMQRLEKQVVREDMDDEEVMVVRVAIRVRYELELKVQQIYNKFLAERELVNKLVQEAVAAKDASHAKATAELSEYINQLHQEVEFFHKKRRQDKNELQSELKLLVKRLDKLEDTHTKPVSFAHESSDAHHCGPALAGTREARRRGLARPVANDFDQAARRGGGRALPRPDDRLLGSGRWRHRRQQRRGGRGGGNGP